MQGAAGQRGAHPRVALSMLRTLGRSLMERKLASAWGSGMVKLRGAMLLMLRCCSWSTTACMRAACAAAQRLRLSTCSWVRVRRP